jgi:CRP-like cAMP-binding protein
MDNRTEPCNCLECMKRCSYFERLSDSDLIRINSMKMAYKYRKGEVILKKGTYNPYIVQISGGYVKTIIEGVLDKCFILEVLGQNNFISPSFTGDNISKSTLVALSDVTVCYLDIKVFTDLMESNGKFAVDVLKYINTNDGYRLTRLMSISLKQTRGKVADVLLYISKIHGDVSVFKFLSRKELAEMANISTENAIRTLKDFEQEGVISINKKEIAFLKPETLHEISSRG